MSAFSVEQLHQFKNSISRELLPPPHLRPVIRDPSQAPLLASWMSIDRAEPVRTDCGRKYSDFSAKLDVWMAADGQMVPQEGFEPPDPIITNE
jgi:hypothetical protein